MTGYRAYLDEEIGALPPSTVDVEATIRRRRRWGRYQRAALVTSVLGLTALTVAGLARLPGWGPADGAGSAGLGAPPASSAPPEPPEPSSIRPSGPPDAAVTEQTAHRLTTALRAKLDAFLPGATYQPNRGGDEATVGPLEFNRRYREPEPNRHPEDYYFATADITLAKGVGRGSIEVMVGRVWPDWYDTRTVCDEGPLDAKEYTCTPTTGPNGETVLQIGQGGSKAKEFQVIVTRPDGIAVFAWVRNYANADSQCEYCENRADAAEPPLTRAQLTELGLDPGLTV